MIFRSDATMEWIEPRQCVGKTFVRKSDSSKAYVVSYRSYWRHDVPPNYEDELVEYFHIETKGQKMSVDCFWFLSEYELLDT